VLGVSIIGVMYPLSHCRSRRDQMTVEAGRGHGAAQRRRRDKANSAFKASRPTPRCSTSKTTKSMTELATIWQNRAV
jgi:hypothetical protein